MLSLVALVGCAATPPGKLPVAGPPQAVAASPVAPAEAAARAGRLDVERDWLRTWFEGTPVHIARQGPALRVDVPLVHSFAPGQPQVKPALGAVLDKVAESLRRNPQARLRLVAAPGDGTGASAGDVALATKRAAQVRAHLRQRGEAEARLASPSRTTVSAVQLRLEEDPT